VRGRWRDIRNNTTVRGELRRVLGYKCAQLGLRARQVEPRGTTHTCPHCHQPARTFASPAPADRRKALDWGPWLCCEHPKCRWNGARDDAASLNIARLGLALFLTARRRTPSQTSTLTSVQVKPALYSRAGATLLLPSQGITPRPREGKQVFYAGWSLSLALRTSRPTGLVAVLSTSHLRKRVLEREVLRV
jgi:putative transposase